MWTIAARARFSADLGWQDHRIDAPRPSVTPTGGIPAPSDADVNFAQPWTFTEERDSFGVVRGEYDFSEAVTAWAALGLRDSDEHNVLANPNSDAAGNLDTGRFDNYREDRVTTGDVGVRAEFRTGSVGHRLVASAAAFKLDSKNAYAFGGYGTRIGSLYAPVVVSAPTELSAGGVMFDPLTTIETETRSYAIADTLSLAEDRVLLTLGARRQQIEQYSYDYNTGALSGSYDARATTPVGAVVFKLSRRWSLYANYAEALQPGVVVPAMSGSVQLSNVGEVLDPFRSKQYETGLKYDSGRFGAAAALFRINQPNTVVADARMSTDGEQRNQGLELSAYGEIAEGLRLLGGATVLDAKLEKTQGGVDQGNRALGVPKVQANLGLEVDVPSVPGLGLDVRAVHTGRQYANNANTLEIPDWTRLDAGVRYAFDAGGRTWTLRARVDNLFDRAYWASTGGASGANYLILGAPRSYTLSVSMDL